jgi:NAD(P)-dependent dehydrogenase (short-subunit alcohol dehydrogenase family)
MNHLFDLTGKVALVTGGSRGIGKAIAIGLAQAGADIIVSSRTLADCQEVAKQIEALGRKALPVACDMAKWEDIDALVEETYKVFGRCDVLVNNAGITQDPLPIVNTDEAMFDKFFQVNTKGFLHLAQLVAPRMAETGGGSVINVISMGGIKPGGYLSMYCASKAAMNSINRCMAEEWAPLGVRVNCIAPGPIMTDMLGELDAATPGYIDYCAEITLLKRVGQAEELVGPALFLASDASSYVTGQTLAVCGGAI